MPNLVTFLTVSLISISYLSFAQSNRVASDIARFEQTVQKMKADFAAVPENPHDINWVSQKIQIMWEIDQFSRRFFKTPFAENYTEKEKADFMSLFPPKLAAVDKENTSAIKDLLIIYPWFKISIFGKKTDSNAWLLVQHADDDSDFQKSVLIVLEALFPTGETSAPNYAYLFDRVASSFRDPAKRMLQRYGTQGFCTGRGTWMPLPSEDEANLDKRRASVGLEPEADYIQRFKDICMEDQTPH